MNEKISPQPTSENRLLTNEALVTQSRKIIDQVLGKVIDLVAEQDQIEISPELKAKIIGTTLFAFNQQQLENIDMQLSQYGNFDVSYGTFYKNGGGGKAQSFIEASTKKMLFSIISIEGRNAFNLIHEMDHTVRAWLGIHDENPEKSAAVFKKAAEQTKKAQPLFALALVLNTLNGIYFTTYGLTALEGRAAPLSAVHAIGLLTVGLVTLYSGIEVRKMYAFKKEYQELPLEKLANNTAKLFLGKDF